MTFPKWHFEGSDGKPCCKARISDPYFVPRTTRREEHVDCKKCLSKMEAIAFGRAPIIKRRDDK